mmetsp:Transcript_1740/g.3321  ORF Transcript_1740/g.3321 Transcript_1740/m.3321 type:complete len:238 (-) Transcript_1740:415-1128(-)
MPAGRPQMDWRRRVGRSREHRTGSAGAPLGRTLRCPAPAPWAARRATAQQRKKGRLSVPRVRRSGRPAQQTGRCWPPPEAPGWRKDLAWAARPSPTGSLLPSKPPAPPLFSPPASLQLWCFGPQQRASRQARETGSGVRPRRQYHRLWSIHRLRTFSGLSIGLVTSTSLSCPTNRRTAMKTMNECQTRRNGLGHRRTRHHHSSRCQHTDFCSFALFLFLHQSFYHRIRSRKVFWTSL